LARRRLRGTFSCQTSPPSVCSTCAIRPTERLQKTASMTDHRVAEDCETLLACILRPVRMVTLDWWQRTNMSVLRHCMQWRRTDMEVLSHFGSQRYFDARWQSSASARSVGRSNTFKHDSYIITMKIPWLLRMTHHHTLTFGGKVCQRKATHSLFLGAEPAWEFYHSLARKRRDVIFR